MYFCHRSLSSSASAQVCEGSAVTFTALPAEGFSNYDYQYDDGQSFASAQSNQQNTYSEQVAVNVTDYRVVATYNGSACGDTSNVVVISVLPALAVNVGQDRNICDDQVITLYAGTTGVSYLWNTGEVTDSISVNGAVLGAGNYPYWAEVTGANGCSARDSPWITVSVCVGIAQQGNNDFNIYPNPADGIIHIAVHGAQSDQ